MHLKNKLNWLNWRACLPMRAQHCTDMPHRFATTEPVRDVGARGRLTYLQLPYLQFILKQSYLSTKVC